MSKRSQTPSSIQSFIYSDGGGESGLVDVVVPAGRAFENAEARIAIVGERLGSSISAVLDAIPGSPYGPADLARILGLDKVLTSRVLNAVRNRDPMAVIHLIPGPDPLRRLMRASAKRTVSADTIAEAADAIDQFERLIRQEAGDRSALDTIISSWLPEARQQFEVRRKQAAFKAMSQIKGAAAEVSIATVLLHPSDQDATRLDIVWVFGVLGLRRLRPGATVKFTSRRLSPDRSPRRPITLSGKSVEDFEGLRLNEFCSQPAPKLDVHNAGDVVHYVLASEAFGPRSGIDLVTAEVNYSEMDRFVPAGSGRKSSVFAEVATPAEVLLFDVFVHQDVYPSSEPSLAIYDTVLEGVASVNDRSRDIDRYDMIETIHSLGRGTSQVRAAEAPSYVELVRHVFDTVRWNAEHFRGYRCRIDYPIYGSQVAMMFDPPAGP